jgi:CelD/BcsL family acetyltransferase involved in cellulose biosynthesis
MLTTMEALPLPASVAQSIRLAEVDGADQFAAMRQQWNGLLRSSAADCPFLTWEWLYAWWAHLAGPARLRVVTACAGDTLVGIAPLKETGRLGARFSRADFLGEGLAGSDYLDLIVRRGWEAESVHAFARFLSQERRTLHLNHLRPGSTALALMELLVADGWNVSITSGGSCPVISLAGHSWDSYLATLGPAHRANVRRRLKALNGRFGGRFERVTSDTVRREALAALMAFHATRWGGGSTAFLTPALRAFQDDATRQALEAGWLRMYVLRTGGSIAAVMYGFAYAGRFYFYQHGFDNHDRASSPGLAMMALSIRAAIEEGAEEFDMLWGLEPYKRLWTRDTRPLDQLHLFPPDVAGTARRWALEARRSLGRLGRRLRRTRGRDAR